MSRQSKQAKNLERARAFSKARKNGEKGPSKTQALHGKRWTYRGNPEIQKRIAEGKNTNEPPARTSKNRVLEGAGAAAK